MYALKGAVRPPRQRGQRGFPLKAGYVARKGGFGE